MNKKGDFKMDNNENQELNGIPAEYQPISSGDTLDMKYYFHFHV